MKKDKILIIDDDQEMTNLIKTLLVYYGYETIVSNDPKKGIDIAKAKKPNVILLDVLMPTMNGREVCRQLKQDDTTKNIPIIFLTAKDSPDDLVAEMDAGASWHITKPFDNKELLNKIKELCP